MRRFMLAAAAAALIIAAPAHAAAAEEAAERAVLVLDASGSMWGQLDNKSKMSVARDVIRKLVTNWNPKVQLGITAYGHRQKGDCTDIETILPVGAVDAGAVMSAVNGLQPKGKTPLSEAVRQAAQALKYTEERATVILVSDGKETCKADPCAVAKELEAAGVDLTVHVIGFDLAEDEKAQLQCIADNTGGKFLNASNAPQLHQAMTKTVQLVAKPEPPKKRVIKLKKAPTGTVFVKGIVNKAVFLYETGQTYVNDITRFNPGRKKPEQVRPGSYVLGTAKQELTRIDIAPGQDAIVDMKQLTGTVFIKGVVNKAVFLYESGQTYVNDIARFNPGRKKPVQVRPGTYVLGTANQELTRIDIAPGQDAIVDMKQLAGTVFIKGVVNKAVFLYEPGKTYVNDITRFNPGRKKPEQVRPGTYVLGTAEQELARIDIAPGQDAIVDIKEFTGSLSVKGVSNKAVFLYEPGKTYVNDITRFNPGRKKPEQVRPGTYVLGTAEQELATIEIAPGEELVVDLGN